MSWTCNETPHKPPTHSTFEVVDAVLVPQNILHFLVHIIQCDRLVRDLPTWLHLKWLNSVIIQNRHQHYKYKWRSNEITRVNKMLFLNIERTRPEGKVYRFTRHDEYLSWNVVGHNAARLRHALWHLDTAEQKDLACNTTVTDSESSLT